MPLHRKYQSRKRGNCECIATRGRPTSRQSFSALITTPMPSLKTRWTYPLLYYSSFAADTLLSTVPLTFNICSVSPVTWWNSIPNLKTIELSTTELLWFKYLTQWPTKWVTCCAWLWDIFTKFEFRQLIRAWIIALFDADTLCLAVTLTFDLELLQHFGCPVFKLCTKFERKRTIHGSVIDDLARFRHVILWCGARLTNSSQGCVDTTHQTWQGHRAIIDVQVCFRVRYIVTFSNAGDSKLSDVKNDAKFRTFWPSVKIREGMGESLDQLMKLSLWPNLRNTSDSYPLCGCLARCIDKKKKRK